MAVMSKVYQSDSLATFSRYTTPPYLQAVKCMMWQCHISTITCCGGNGSALQQQCVQPAAPGHGGMCSTFKGGSRRLRHNSPNEGVGATWRSGLKVCHAVPHHDDCLEPVGLQMGQKWEQSGPVGGSRRAAGGGEEQDGQRQINAAWGNTGIAIDHSSCAPAGHSSAHRLDVLHRVPLAAAVAGELCGVKPGVAAIILQAGKYAGRQACGQGQQTLCNKDLI